eukprot:251549-Prymnesium_polylepis.1
MPPRVQADKRHWATCWMLLPRALRNKQAAREGGPRTTHRATRAVPPRSPQTSSVLTARTSSAGGTLAAC